MQGGWEQEGAVPPGTAVSPDLQISDRARELRAKLIRFCVEDVAPATADWRREHAELSARAGTRWVVPERTIGALKRKARALGLWNLFLPKYHAEGPGLTNLEYAHLAEVMGRYPLSSEACNCSAPDTGNMETIAKYGNAEQKRRWLGPLMNGEIRSVFLMTEPRVASSDATNIETRIELDARTDEYVINGRKWWSSGAMDPRCKIGVLMGKTNPAAPRHRQQSMVLVPMDAPGITVLRALEVFGYDDAPHGHAEVTFKDVRVPRANLLLGEGRGFEIAQGRLGPGRIHHCMRAIGSAEVAQDLMVARAQTRTAFGKKLHKHGTVARDIATNRMEIDQARLLVLHCAALIDAHGDARGARKEVAMIKVVVPQMACRVIDRALQAHGGAGVCQDFPLAEMYAHMRTLRIADGPDEVHVRTVARLEMRKERRSKL